MHKKTKTKKGDKMDTLILNEESLFIIADTIANYCVKQKELIETYYSKIISLESEWDDDETFGSLMEEINILKNKAYRCLDEINNIYPRYFRAKAQHILNRPKIYDKDINLMNVYKRYKNLSTNFTSNTLSSKNKNIEVSSFSNSISSLNIEACNEALTRDETKMQMVNISNIAIEGSSNESFWTNHGGNENGYQKVMAEYVNMMQNYSNGMSLEQCWEKYPDAANAFFGRKDPIRLDNSYGTLTVSNGRHRIAMAQKLGIKYLPAKVFTINND